MLLKHNFFPPQNLRHLKVACNCITETHSNEDLSQGQKTLQRTKLCKLYILHGDLKALKL